MLPPWPGQPDYYDPSFGLTATNAADYTSVVIAGWGKVFPDGVHYRKINEMQENVRFVIFNW